jgi:lipid-binding SYLF domain-containing protein
MRGLVFAASVAALAATSAFAAETAQDRLGDSARVLSEIMSTPDKGIPHDLLAKAQCVVIVPGLKKGAFIVGAEYGRGDAICRKRDGVGWGAPAAIRMEGGSFGFQIGGSDTDVIMLVMSRHGMDRLMEDKFELGGDASIAAGPVGRTTSATTDASLTADMLSWSRSKGLFAGIALKGATIRPDADRNAELYGTKMGNKEVLMGNLKSPEAARPLVHELDRDSDVSAADRAK